MPIPKKRWLVLTSFVALLIVGVFYWRPIIDLLYPRSHKAIGVVKLGGGEPSVQSAEIIFVHGLNGDARTTWECNPDKHFFWPEWLGQQLPEVGVFSIDYDAFASEWLGVSMPLEDRAKNLLEEMRLRGHCDKPFVFVCHSLGGIVVKQMIMWAASNRGIKAYDGFLKNLRGVVFMATPHTGSDMAVVLTRLGKTFHLRLNETARELQDNNSKLRALNELFANNAEKLGVNVRVLFETVDVPLVGRIVNESQSMPGIPGIQLTPISRDHLQICKPDSPEDLVCLSVKEFAETCLKQANFPAGADAYPSPKEFMTPDRVPEEAVVLNHIPKVRAEEAEFAFLNQTDVDLELALFDCYRHYSGADSYSCFKLTQFERSSSPKMKGDFLPPSSGYFCIFYRKAKLGKFQYLTTAPLFDISETLVVTGTFPEIKYEWR